MERCKVCNTPYLKGVTECSDSLCPFGESKRLPKPSFFGVQFFRTKSGSPQTSIDATKLLENSYQELTQEVKQIDLKLSQIHDQIKEVERNRSRCFKAQADWIPDAVKQLDQWKQLHNLQIELGQLTDQRIDVFNRLDEIEPDAEGITREISRRERIVNIGIEDTELSALQQRLDQLRGESMSLNTQLQNLEEIEKNLIDQKTVLERLLLPGLGSSEKKQVEALVQQEEQLQKQENEVQSNLLYYQKQYRSLSSQRDMVSAARQALKTLNDQIDQQKKDFDKEREYFGTEKERLRNECRRLIRDLEEANQRTESNINIRWREDKRRQSILLFYVVLIFAVVGTAMGLYYGFDAWHHQRRDLSFLTALGNLLFGTALFRLHKRTEAVMKELTSETPRSEVPRSTRRKS